MVKVYCRGLNELTSNWSPGGSKEEDVDADECDGSSLCTEILREHGAVGSLASRSGTEDGNEQLADGHTDG